MKQYREETIATSQDFDAQNPCLLVEHIAWLSEQFAKIPVASQATACIEFTQDYDDVSTRLSIVYDRLETDQEEQLREEARAKYLAEQARRDRQSAEMRRLQVMKSVEKMSAEEKQAMLDHLQQLSETSEKES